MKYRKPLIIGGAMVIMVAVPVIRYYTTTPNINSCVLEYVENMDKSGFKGVVYNIDGIQHIETENGAEKLGLEEMKVGSANGCLMSTDNLFADLNNTFYCTVSYMIKKAPISDKLKEPIKNRK